MVSLLVKTRPGLSDEAVDAMATRSRESAAGASAPSVSMYCVPQAALEGVMHRFQEDADVERVEVEQRRQIAQDAVAPASPNDPVTPTSGRSTRSAGMRRGHPSRQSAPLGLRYSIRVCRRRAGTSTLMTAGQRSAPIQRPTPTVMAPGSPALRRRLVTTHGRRRCLVLEHLGDPGAGARR